MARGSAGGAERARRLVALLGQLAPGTRVAVADLGAELGVSEAELTADLSTLTLCGVAPYYPDDYMPLVLENGFVEVTAPLPALKGPVRLSAAEAGALASALQAAGFSAQDELTTRLLEATGAVEFDAAELERTVRSALATHEAAVYGALALAVQKHAVVQVTYASAGTEELTEREIEPLTLFAERAAWYVTAWCRKAGDWRTFRVDRIRSAGLTGDTFEPRDQTGAPSATAAFSAAGLPTARLRFSAEEPFSERDWPGGRIVEQPSDGTTVAEVPYGGTDWISRRVVARLGRVEVLEPETVRSAVRELATSLRGS